MPLSRGIVWVLIQKYAKVAGLEGLNIHPHMLRHACGYDLANRGGDTRLIQGFLGHRNIQHTVKYTELDPRRYASLGCIHLICQKGEVHGDDTPTSAIRERGCDGQRMMSQMPVGWRDGLCRYGIKGLFRNSCSAIYPERETPRLAARVDAGHLRVGNFVPKLDFIRYCR